MIRKGFSLIEVLVSVAIVALLAALLLAASGSARKRAIATHDTANLRQIGQAHALYQTTTDSDGWFSTPPLIQAAVLDRALVASPHDPTPQGIANRVRVERYPGAENPPTAWKDSYLAYDMTGWQTEGNRRRFSGYFAEAKGSGWLIALDTPGNYRTMRFWDEPGAYQRLLMDTAVVHRRIHLPWIGWGDKRNKVLKGCRLYTDDDSACEKGGL